MPRPRITRGRHADQCDCFFSRGDGELQRASAAASCV